MENRLEIYTTPLNFRPFTRSESVVLDAASLTRTFNSDFIQSIYHIILKTYRQAILCSIERSHLDCHWILRR
jgi:hypothetical protein